MTDRVIHHRDNCRGVELEPIRGRLGDDLVRCRGCGRFALAPMQPAATVTPERDDPPPVVVAVLTPPAASGWVCRLHSRPVSWRGTGCPECVAEHAARQRTRAQVKARQAQARRDRAVTR